MGDAPPNPYDAAWAAEADLLLPSTEMDYLKFTRAVAIAFEIPPGAAYDIANYDLLWLPDGRRPGLFELNYYQLVTIDSARRDPTANVLSYLADAEDERYEEPYDREADEEERVAAWRAGLRARHPAAADYLRAVARRLFLEGEACLLSYEENLRHKVWEA